MNKRNFFLIIVFSIMLLIIAFFIHNAFKKITEDQLNETRKIMTPLVTEKIMKEFESDYSTSSIYNIIDKKKKNIQLFQLLIFKNSKIVFDLNNEGAIKSNFISENITNYDFLAKYLTSTEQIFVKEQIGGENFFLSIIPYFDENMLIQNRIVFFHKILFDFNFKTLFILLLFALNLSFIFFFFLYLEKKQITSKLNEAKSFVYSSSFNNNYPKTIFEHKSIFSDLYKEIIFFVEKKKTIEKKLKVKEDQFNLLVGSSTDGIVIENTKGVITFANSKFATMLGYNSAQQLIGLSFTEIIFDQRNIEIYETQTISRTINQATRYKLELITSQKKSLPCIISASVHCDDQGHILEYYGTILSSESITQLSTSNNKRSSTDAVTAPAYIVVDLKNNIIDFNSKAISLFGLSKKDIKTQKIESIFEQHSALEQYFQTNSPDANKCEIFEPYLNKWLLVESARNLIDSKVSSIYTFVDISKIKEVEKYHESVFNDIDGFIFFTSLDDKIEYISPNFTKISGNDFLWFEDFFNSIFKNVNLEEGVLIEDEILMIFGHNSMVKFKVLQSINKTKRLKTYICYSIKSEEVN